jgi:integrase
MNTNSTCYDLTLSDAERVLDSYLAALGGQSSNYQSVHRSTIRRLLADHVCSGVSPNKHLALDQPGLLHWTIRYLTGRSIPNARQRLAILTSYLDALVRAGLVERNLLSDFKASHGNLSWDNLIPALQSADPSAALAALYSEPRLPGPLHAHLRAYLELQQSLGKKFEPQKYILNRFDQYLQGHLVTSLEAVTPTMLKDWMDTLTCSPTTRIRYAHMVRRFFDHLHNQQVMVTNPVPILTSESRRGDKTFRPFIFTQEQMAAILAKARQLPKTCYSPFKGLTCYTMLVLLYALGLRHGEARRLRIRDLDFARQTLSIEQTKFHKNRYVPFGPKVGFCLQQFLEVRRTFLQPLQPDDPLFVTLWRRPFDHHLLLDAFHEILRELAIAGLVGRRGPRIHDLRHTFAVHRLLRWYRDGVDVQSKLPILSTFLGHVKPRSTEVYLTITAELLREANARFQRHFGYLFDKEVCQ